MMGLPVEKVSEKVSMMNLLTTKVWWDWTAVTTIWGLLEVGVCFPSNPNKYLS